MKKLVDGYNKFESHLLVFSLAFTVVIIFIQVIMRYVFNSSLSWSEELARYIFIWQIWLGASLSFKDNAHISVDLLPNALKPKPRQMLFLLANLIVFAFSVFLVVYGCQLSASMMSRGLLSTALRIPMFLVYAVLPFSHFVISLRLIGRMRDNIKQMLSPPDEENAEGGLL